MNLSSYFNSLLRRCQTNINLAIHQPYDENNEFLQGIDTPLISEITTKLKLAFSDEKAMEGEVCFINSEEVRPEFKISFTLIDLFDYIYAVLHSSNFNKQYQPGSNINVSLIPYPTNTIIFWKLVKLGKELRQIHMFELPFLANIIAQFPVIGTNKITDLKFADDKVYINETQYFSKVPLPAWQLPILGYQPAQQWLIDRTGRELSAEDIVQYQKIVAALTETGRLMKVIDAVKIV